MLRKMIIPKLLLILFPFFIWPYSLIATPLVEIWGHADCQRCVMLKEELQGKGIRVRSHDLKRREVEDYYVRNFGRGDIPVVRVGKVVRRGVGADAVMRLISTDKTSVSKEAAGDAIDSHQIQCVAGGVVDKVILTKSLPQKAQRLPERNSDEEVAIDICYGTKGWLKCQNKRIPFSKIVELKPGVYEVITTSKISLRVEDSSCRTYRY
jgi:glutaredoxin